MESEMESEMELESEFGSEGFLEFMAKEIEELNEAAMEDWRLINNGDLDESI